MKTPEQISLIDARRQALTIWVITNKKTFKELAEAAGIAPSTLSEHLSSPTMPVKRHEKLIAAGVPAEHLPEPEDKVPGRKPGQYSAMSLAQSF